MNKTLGFFSRKESLQTLLVCYLISFQPIAYAAVTKEAPQAKPQVQADMQATPKTIGEDPGPVYTQMVMQWAKVTHFAQNAAEVIVGKFKLEMENDPKIKPVMTPALLSDLEQFFYELFLSPETIKELAALYAQYFTLDDMQALIKFYQSPVGQKLIKVEPELKIKTQQIGQILLKKHEREYMGIIGKYLVKSQSQKDKAKTD